ncbi:MAG: hypothetical protein IT325_12030 [Anaerolineae bacterium]|nr:hypothetical protein [Anaerolineae bacterium]
MRLFAKPRTHAVLILGLLVGLGLLALVSRVEASDGMRGDRCVVAETDYIVEDFYFLCRVLEVRGTIDGDLLGIGSEVHIYPTATVTGDVWVAGGRLRVEGAVGDDLHFAGMNVLISEKARISGERTDLLALALNVEIMPDAHLPGDLLVYGYQAEINGLVGGDVDFSGESLTIQGRVGGRIDASVGDWRRDTDIPGLPVYNISFNDPGLAIGDTAFIGGDLNYEAPSRRPIPPGVVQGRITYDAVVSQPDITNLGEADNAARLARGYASSVLRDVITLLLIGAPVLILWPSFITQPAQHIRRRTIPAAGWGLVAFMLAFPFSVILIVLSLIVLALLLAISLEELAIIAGAGMLIGNLAFIAGFGFLLLYMGRVVVSFAIGYLVLRFIRPRPDGSPLRRSLWSLAAGVLVYTLLTNAPVPPLGLIFELVTALAGVGAVVMFLRTWFYNVRTPEEVPVVIPAETQEAALAPSFAEEYAGQPGMDNLPEGFTGFDEG